MTGRIPGTGKVARAQARPSARAQARPSARAQARLSARARVQVGASTPARAPAPGIVLLVAVALSGTGLGSAAPAMEARAHSAAGQAQAAPQRDRPPHGRLFRPEDLGLLEGPDREAWQQPELIMDLLRIADGATVADVGAGGGWFTVRLARRVGPNGLVYAEDIQPQMLESINRRVRREGLANVRTIRGTPTDPHLPSPVDAVLIVDVYGEVAVEDRVELLGNLVLPLKPGGRVGIVDYKLDGGGPGPPLAERVEPEAVVRDAQAAGLRLLAREDLRYQYVLVFVADTAP